MKKQTKHQYDNMMQVYRKMHEEVVQLAQQVLELEDEEYNLPSDILHEVKHFLESVFMYLKGYIEQDDLTNSWFKMYNKKQEYYRYIWYNWYLSHNILLPL